jgi:uncharacterized protein (DUF952 family)
MASVRRRHGVRRCRCATLLLGQIGTVPRPSSRWNNGVPPSLQTEGFVHLSLDSQVVGSRQRHFSAVAAEELLVVEVDAALLDAPLRWEAPPGRPGERYPHVYGPLPLRAIRSVMTYDQWLTMSSRNDLRESS